MGTKLHCYKNEEGVHERDKKYIEFYLQFASLLSDVLILKFLLYFIFSARHADRAL